MKLNISLSAAPKYTVNQQVQVKQEQAAAEKEIDEASLEAKRQLLQTTSQILGGLADLAGKQTEEGKILAIAQATIDTYLSASSAYAAAAKIDPIVLAPLAAGAAILGIFATLLYLPYGDRRV